MPKIIGFYGSYPADICMYAACALQNTGRRVCVIDNSDDGVLFHCIPASGMQMKTVSFHNVDFMRLEPIVQWHELDYEYVLVQLGAQPPQLCLALCSACVLVVDCERKNLDFYHQYMQQNSMPASVLLRGFCRNRSPLQRVKEYFANGNCLIEEWILLPLNEEDETCRLEMQFGMLDQFVHISADMERALMKLLCTVEMRGIKH